MNLDELKKNISQVPFKTGQQGEPGEFDDKKPIAKIVDEAIKKRRMDDMKKRYPDTPPTLEQINERKRRFPDSE